MDEHDYVRDYARVHVHDYVRAHVLHDDVTGVLRAGQARFQHRKATLHKEHQYGSDDVPRTAYAQNGYRSGFHFSILPIKDLLLLSPRYSLSQDFVYLDRIKEIVLFQ